MSEENEPKIRVKDRRMFNLDGTMRTPDPDDVGHERHERAAPSDNVVPLEGRSPSSSQSAKPPREAPSPKESEPRQTTKESEESASRPGEPSLFADLVSSLAYQAAMLMGLIRDPLGPQMP